MDFDSGIDTNYRNYEIGPVKLIALYIAPNGKNGRDAIDHRSTSRYVRASIFKKIYEKFFSRENGPTSNFPPITAFKFRLVHTHTQVGQKFKITHRTDVGEYTALGTRA